MSELFLGDSEDPVPSAGMPDVGGVEDTGDMTGTGGELVNYEYQQCVIRQWYRTLLIYILRRSAGCYGLCVGAGLVPVLSAGLACHLLLL